MKYLLDTCVISELVAKQPNPRVVEWIDGIDSDDAYLSVITIGEITKGVEKLSESKRKRALHDWLKDELLVRFEGKLVTLDTDVLIAWGKLTAKMESVGQQMPAIDSLIAASAIQGGFTLVTRNEVDFAGSGVKLVNPWRSGQQ